MQNRGNGYHYQTSPTRQPLIHGSLTRGGDHRPRSRERRSWSIVLPRYCSHTVLMHALAGVGVLDELPRRYVQVPEGCFILHRRPFISLRMGLRQRQDGVTIRFIGDDDARRYLSRMELFRLLEVPFAETFRRQSETGRFLPVATD